MDWYDRYISICGERRQQHHTSDALLSLKNDDDWKEHRRNLDARFGYSRKKVGMNE